MRILFLLLLSVTGYAQQVQKAGYSIDAYCKQKDAAAIVQYSGAALFVAGYAAKENNAVIMGLGGVTFAAGCIMSTSANKHLKQAAKYFTGNGIAITIK